MAAPPRRSSPGGVAAAGLFVAGAWTAGALLPVGVDAPGPIYVASDYVYSLMLASYAAIGWLALRLAPGLRAVRAFAWLLALAGIAGAIGNFLEDILAVSGAEYLYGVGFFGAFAGFLGLAFALLAARSFGLALVVGGTLVGIAVMAGGGPPVVPVLWTGVGAVALASWLTHREPSGLARRL